MKLIRLNPSTVPTYKYNMPVIRFHKKGSITISQSACDIIGLKNTSTVEFIFDEESKKDFYITRSDKGFTLRHSGKRNTGFKIWAASLVNKILATLSAPVDCQTIAVPMSKEPIEVDGELLYALITSAIKK